jgi:hypothetical protein
MALVALAFTIEVHFACFGVAGQNVLGVEERGSA